MGAAIEGIVPLGPALRALQAERLIHAVDVQVAIGEGEELGKSAEILRFVKHADVILTPRNDGVLLRQPAVSGTVAQQGGSAARVSRRIVYARAGVAVSEPARLAIFEPAVHQSGKRILY